MFELIKAIRQGNIAVIQILLENGADVNVADDSGVTPLMRAIAENHLDIVKLLINSGANVNASDEYNMQPLHWAISEQHNQSYDHEPLLNRKVCINIVRILLEKGADVNASASNGLTPIEWLDELSTKKYPKIKKLLKRYQNLTVNGDKIYSLLFDIGNKIEGFSSYKGEKDCTFGPAYEGKEYAKIKDTEKKIIKMLKTVDADIIQIGSLIERMEKSFRKLKATIGVKIKIIKK